MIQNWDEKKTLQQNYAAMGLKLDANEDIKTMNRRKKEQEEEKQEAYGFMTEELNEIADLPPQDPRSQQVKSMSLQEQYRLRDMLRKHGDDYQKMSRDLALNTLQETARQIEKRMTLYLKLRDAGTPSVQVK